MGRWLRAGLSLAVAVAILAIALPVAFGAGRQGGGVSPLKVFSSGSALTVDASGSAQLSVSNLVPGQSRTAAVRLSNAGSGVSLLTLSTRLADRVAPGGKPLSSLLRLRIASPSGTVLYDGALGGLRRLRVGRIGPGASRAFDFTVTLPRNADNEVEGSMLSAGFAWTAA